MQFVLTGPDDLTVRFQIAQLSGYVTQVKFQHLNGSNKYYNAVILSVL